MEKLESCGNSDDLVWKAAKPLLQVYVPLKATGGQARERVQPIAGEPVEQIPSGRGEGKWTQHQLPQKETGEQHETLKAAKDKGKGLACDELVLACCLYASQCG